MITVHHLNNSRSQRVLWLLEELVVPYEIKRYQRDATTMLAPPELRAIHPLGKSPVITDDSVSGGPIAVAESGAIVEYLLERYDNGTLLPTEGSPERRQYTYWLHFAEGSAMPPLLLKLIFDRVATSPMAFFAKPIARGIASRVKAAFIAPNIARHLEFMEQALAAQCWFAGAEFSAADIQMSFPLEVSRSRGGLDDRYPRCTQFLERIHARPAYINALARGGAYTL